MPDSSSARLKTLAADYLLHIFERARAGRLRRNETADCAALMQAFASWTSASAPYEIAEQMRTVVAALEQSSRHGDEAIAHADESLAKLTVLLKANRERSAAEIAELKGVVESAKALDAPSGGQPRRKTAARVR